MASSACSKKDGVKDGLLSRLNPVFFFSALIEMGLLLFYADEKLGKHFPIGPAINNSNADMRIVGV